MADEIQANPGPDIALRQSDAETMQRAMRGVTTGRAAGMAHQEAERQLRKAPPRKTYGGSMLLSPGSMKFSYMHGVRESNLADKREFREMNDRAKAGFFDGSRGSERSNDRESTNAG